MSTIKQPALSLVISTWWRHQMETFSALLAICTGNSPVPGEFGPRRRYRAHYNVTVMMSNIKEFQPKWGGNKMCFLGRDNTHVYDWFKTLGCKWCILNPKMIKLSYTTPDAFPSLIYTSYFRKRLISLDSYKRKKRNTIPRICDEDFILT